MEQTRTSRGKQHAAYPTHAASRIQEGEDDGRIGKLTKADSRLWVAKVHYDFQAYVGKLAKVVHELPWTFANGAHVDVYAAGPKEPTRDTRQPMETPACASMFQKGETK